MADYKMSLTGEEIEQKLNNYDIDTPLSELLNDKEQKIEWKTYIPIIYGDMRTNIVSSNFGVKSGEYQVIGKIIFLRVEISSPTDPTVSISAINLPEGYLAKFHRNSIGVVSTLDAYVLNPGSGELSNKLNVTAGYFDSGDKTKINIRPMPTISGGQVLIFDGYIVLE